MPSPRHAYAEQLLRLSGCLDNGIDWMMSADGGDYWIDVCESLRTLAMNSEFDFVRNPGTNASVGPRSGFREEAPLREAINIIYSLASSVVLPFDMNYVTRRLNELLGDLVRVNVEPPAEVDGRVYLSSNSQQLWDIPAPPPLMAGLRDPFARSSRMQKPQIKARQAKLGAKPKWYAKDCA